ncbi:unnamed protein product [Brachionus calyciflorus]|uniref:Calcyphosin-2 PH domain-containing protein n=1 Tax=Brachionus calyciflorus TaxID=104777 RepID=A0A814E348_9BILA|nr:unnamed protein product [Brachionus calyciflorus]
MSMTRIVRNPITGEEIIYKKGLKNPQNETKIPDLTHEERVKNLLESSRSEFITYDKKYEIKSESKPDLSLVANASSIPLLNLNELQSDESRTKLNLLKNNNPIIAPSLVENSARPKSNYSYALNQLNSPSPLLAYHDKINKNPSPLVSNLPAPRPEEATIIPQPSNPAVLKKSSIYKIERVADLEKLWLDNGIQTPKPSSQDETKLAKEKLIIDTVVTDQLSKFVLSNNQKTIYTPRGNKYTLIDNHSRPTSSLSENSLAKKCKFNCRIRTPNGRLALKDLFGIIFLHDGSLTIYEFRLLCGAYLTGTGSGNVSKKANALPFLNRKVYVHENGERRGKQIDLYDIYKGSILYVSYNLNDTMGLPQTARLKDYLEIEITDVNELEKENLLIGEILAQPAQPGEDMNKKIFNVKERLKSKLNDVEIRNLKIINSVRKFILKQIEDRSVEVYMGLSRILKSKNFINCEQLHEAFQEFNIEIHAEDLRIVWECLDWDKLDQMNYYNVLRSYLGEMNVERHGFFRQLMHKLDTQKTGYVQVSDIYKYYKAARHPRVKNGNLQEDEMFKKFLSSFDLIPLNKVQDYFEISTSSDMKSPLITYEQLEEYYNGLSIVVESDDDFINILKNSWNQ